MCLSSSVFVSLLSLKESVGTWLFLIIHFLHVFSKIFFTVLICDAFYASSHLQKKATGCLLSWEGCICHLLQHCFYLYFCSLSQNFNRNSLHLREIWKSSVLLTRVTVCLEGFHMLWWLLILGIIGFWHDLENLHLCSLILRFNFNCFSLSANCDTLTCREVHLP